MTNEKDTKIVSSIVGVEAPNRVTLFLKSGHTIQVVCDNFKIIYDAAKNAYTECYFEGQKSPSYVSVLPDQIVGYTVD